MIAQDLQDTLLHVSETSFEAFVDPVSADFVREACENSGTITLRKRKLPVGSVIWLVLGTVFFTETSIRDVLLRLGLYKNAQGKAESVASSATTKARQRVGAAVFRELFGLLSKHWDESLESLNPLWRGLRLYAIDGTTLTTQDSDANRECFGGPSNQHGPVGYPQIRVLVLLNLGLRLVIHAVHAGYSGKGSGEQSMLRGMHAWIPNRSVLLFDAGLMNTAEMWFLQSGGEERHWLGRVKASRKYAVTKVLGKGDELARMRISAKVRKQDPSLPESYLVRVLTRHGKDGSVVRMMTSLLDQESYSADELWTLYDERWGIETSFRESKTIMLPASTPLRSRFPEGVEQELWSVFIAYNLVRVRMAQAAHKAKVAPTQISFKRAYLVIRVFIGAARFVQASQIQDVLDDIDRDIGELLVPKRVKGRSFPREIKRRGNRHPQKRRKPKEESLK